MEQQFRTIRIHPDGAQIVCSEQPCLLLIVVLTILTGWDGLLPEYTKIPLLSVIGCLLLYLLFRYMYITRMVFVIGGEQIMHEHGIFTTQRDYIELYRVVDYSEHRTFTQMILGLKTVSVFSGDRTSPRLDIIGVFEKDNIIQELRYRVEVNKTRRNIHEFTNMQ